MAGAGPADALHAGTDEPDAVGRGAAERARHAGIPHTKDLISSSPSFGAHDQSRDEEDDGDDNSIASSTGTAGHRRSSNKAKGKGRAGVQHLQQPQHHHHHHHQHHYQQQQQQQQQQQLRKSASTSTTDTTASAQTNASTEVRAAVSNRASRAALNQRSRSIASSPIIPQDVVDDDNEDFDVAYSSTGQQYTGISYRRGVAANPAAGPATSFQIHSPASGGIVQVNPAPPPSPPPTSSSSSSSQHQGRGAMASSFLPSIFGRRRPTSSASAATASSAFAAKNPPPPGAQAFDFSNILSSLEADDNARAEIDAIAEICGHSRLSLANAHANHRDPVGEVIGSPAAAGQYSETRVAAGLDPVWENRSSGRQDEAVAGSQSASQVGEDRWQMGGGNERGGDDRGVARQAARGMSGVAFGRSASIEEEGRARRQLTRVRDSSGERDQRRRRRTGNAD